MFGLYRILGKLTPLFALVYGLFTLSARMYTLNAAAEALSDSQLSALVIGSALLGVAYKVVLLLAAGAIFTYVADRHEESQRTETVGVF